MLIEYQSRFEWDRNTGSPKEQGIPHKWSFVPSQESEPVMKELKQMQAIIVTGGKQYKVSEGDVIFVEKLEAEAGEAITFDQVLAVMDGDNATFGAPTVEGASVAATVVKNGKGKKIRIFKYTPKKGFRKRQGHRQPYTKVQIGAIKA